MFGAVVDVADGSRIVTSVADFAIFFFLGFSRGLLGLGLDGDAEILGFRQATQKGSQSQQEIVSVLFAWRSTLLVIPNEQSTEQTFNRTRKKEKQTKKETKTRAKESNADTHAHVL